VNDCRDNLVDNGHLVRRFKEEKIEYVNPECLGMPQQCWNKYNLKLIHFMFVNQQKLYPAEDGTCFTEGTNKFHVYDNQTIDSRTICLHYCLYFVQDSSVPPGCFRNLEMNVLRREISWNKKEQGGVQGIASGTAQSRTAIQ
jgi:hypothetical protein